MMREYAQGYAQSTIQPVADFIAPTVQVPTSIGRFKSYSEKNRFKIPNTLRGMGGRAVELSFTAEDKTYNCSPHALDFPVDKLEELEEAQMESALQEGARMIAEVASLAHEKDVIDKAIAAAGTADATPNWGGSATVDAVNSIDLGIIAVIKAARYGSLMNVGIVFGATAFTYFKGNAAVRARFITMQKGSGNVVIPNDLDTVGKLFVGTPECKLSLMVYDTTHEGATDSISFLLDSDVLIFARNANPTRRDPSFMKTFRLAGQWMVPGSYTRDDGRVDVAKFDWSEDVQATNSAACYRLTPTFT